MEWKEWDRVRDFWEDVKDHSYYILGLVALVLLPFLLVAPAADFPRPSPLNGIYDGHDLPILSEIYALGRNAGLFGSNTFVLNILSLCAIWAIFAASWDMLSGYTGQVSFGHAAFWAIAAYFSFWLATGMTVAPAYQDIFGDEIVLEPLTALIYGAIVSAVLAFFIGIIALRVKGPNLALMTLIIPLIIRELPIIFREVSFLIFEDIDTGGDFGNPFVPRVTPSVRESYFEKGIFTGWREIDALNFYIFVMLVFLVAVGLMMMIAFSRLGLAFQSIREDEDAAESLGINVRFYKTLAFTLSAFFAGIAGGLYSQWLGHVGPSMFDPGSSFTVIIMCVIGGVGSITGGVIAAFSLTILLNVFLNDVFREVDALDLLAYGCLLIITLRYMRFGLTRATKGQKRACVFGILFALSWAILDGIIVSDIYRPVDSIIDSIRNLQNLQDVDSISFYFRELDIAIVIYPAVIGLLIMLLLTLLAIPVFLVSEIVGMFVLEEVLGMSFSTSPPVNETLKAKFLIYASVGIPYAYYLPKIFKKVRLRFWGVWPSVGRYEPD